MAKMPEKISGCALFLRLARNSGGLSVDNLRSQGSDCGGETEPGASGMAPAQSKISIADSGDAHEGDVIRGLRSGLIFSLALWAMLFTFGALVFS